MEKGNSTTIDLIVDILRCQTEIQSSRSSFEKASPVEISSNVRQRIANFNRLQKLRVTYFQVGNKRAPKCSHSLDLSISVSTKNSVWEKDFVDRCYKQASGMLQQFRSIIRQ